METIIHMQYSECVFEEKCMIILVVTLVGFINSENNQKEFKQGLKELPLIENECYLFSQLHHRFRRANCVCFYPKIQ